MVNPVSEGKRRAHAARRRRADEQQLVAKYLNAKFCAKVEIMTRRALYARGNYDERSSKPTRPGKTQQPRQNNRHVDDVVQRVLVEFFHHPDWLTKGDRYIWRTVNLEIGHEFRGGGTKPGFGTQGSIARVKIPAGGLGGCRRAPVSTDEFGTEQYRDEPSYAADYDNIHEPGYDDDDGDEDYGYE